MALATGADLATEVAAAMPNAAIAARIPNYVLRAEAKLNRLLRTLDNETVNQNFPVTGEYMPVPPDFLEFKSGHLNTVPKQILQFMPGDTQSEFYGLGSGPPKFFSIVGNNFRFAPAPDAVYSATMVYAAKLVSISSGGVTTNWLMAQHPDLYLYATLIEASIDASDNEALQKFVQAYQECVGQLKVADNRKRWGGNSMQVRCA